MPMQILLDDYLSIYTIPIGLLLIGAMVNLRKPIFAFVVKIEVLHMFVETFLASGSCIRAAF